MRDFTVLVPGDTSQARQEFYTRGRRPDVFVRADGKIYKLDIEDSGNLPAQNKEIFLQNGYHFLEPNTLFIREVTNKVIINTVNKLYESGFFRRLKPANISDSNEVPAGLKPMQPFDKDWKDSDEILGG